MKAFLILPMIVSLTACASSGGTTTRDTIQDIIQATCNANVPNVYIEAAKLEAGTGAALQVVAALACRIFSDPNRNNRASVRAVQRRLASR
jgi:predicted outer membrane protein